jgi:pimeloyl-ACP methyl ester carboxylesterase
VHVVEAGDPEAVPFLFLHGWPESWRSWQPVMRLAASQVRAIAIDLPGIGESAGNAGNGEKRQLAGTVQELITKMELRQLTLVGHDIGGMIVYSFLRAYRGLKRAVIMDIAVPGIPPWGQLVSNPDIWHFGLHGLPELPERLVQGSQAEYFAYFYDTHSADPAKITPESRAAHAKAYSSDGALTVGFNWYRAFPRDAEENQATKPPVSTPLLFLQGEHGGGDISASVNGFRAAGFNHVDRGIVPGAGHFSEEEAPAETWRLISRFAGLQSH